MIYFANNVLKGLITSVEYSRSTHDSTYLNGLNLLHEVGLTSVFRSPQKQRLFNQISAQFSTEEERQMINQMLVLEKAPFYQYVMLFLPETCKSLEEGTFI